MPAIQSATSWKSLSCCQFLSGLEGQEGRDIVVIPRQQPPHAGYPQEWSLPPLGGRPAGRKSPRRFPAYAAAASSLPPGLANAYQTYRWRKGTAYVAWRCRKVGSPLCARAMPSSACAGILATPSMRQTLGLQLRGFLPGWMPVAQRKGLCRKEVSPWSLWPCSGGDIVAEQMPGRQRTATDHPAAFRPHRNG